MNFKKITSCLMLLFCLGAFMSFGQTVEHGHESNMGTVNFTTLANYLLLHPEPFVVRDEDDEDEDVIIPHVRPVDPAGIRRRSTTTGGYLPLGITPTLPVSPSPTDTFQSAVDPLTTIPPDTHGAVDSNYCVTAINTNVIIQTRSGGAVSSVSLNSFFSSVNSANGTFDPRVHYDPYTNRWILVCVSGANNSSDTTSILIGVTQTSNPTGTWNLYRVRAYSAATYWLDYPDVGFNNKWITVTGNLFQNSPGTGYNGAKVFVFNKANLLAGTGASYTAFTQSTSFTICPALNYDATAGNMFAVEDWNGTVGGGGVVNLWKISGAVGSEAMAHVAYPASPYNWDYANNIYSGTYGSDFAPQASTSNKVQTNDSRVTQLTYINGKLWFAHTVFLPYTGTTNATRSSVQWWQIDTTGTPSQVGLIDDATGSNFYAFPSIAVNTSNDALIGFAAFSSSMYPSAAYAMRVHTDATDSIRPLTIFRHGLASYYKTFSGTKNRWGDYSGTCLDPTNQTDFWTIQEASQTHTTADRWSTWWAHVLTPCTTPAAITGTASVCTGATTTLSDATTGGTWTSTTTSVATIGSSTGVVTGVSAGTSIITYSTGSGCEVTVTVTVNTTPSAISGTATVCTGATTTLSSSPSGGTWTSGSTGVATVGSGSGVVTGGSAGTAVITYTLTGGCTATKTVTVSTTPSTPTGTLSVCVGATTSLSSSPSGGTWTSSNTGIATVGSTGTVTGVSSGTANITYTGSGGCFAFATVTVNTAPTSITGTATVCTGSTTTLSSTPSGGTWTSGSTGVATVGSSSGVVTGNSAGTAVITYTLTGGCFVTRTVTVSTTPAAITGASSICDGTTTTMSDASSGGTWTTSNITIATIGSSSGVVTGIASGCINITYTLGSCFVTFPFCVIANPSAITGTATLCVGTTTTLSSTPSGGSWTSSNTAIATVGSSSGIVTGIAAGTADITYTVTGGCIAIRTVTVSTSPTVPTGTLSVCIGSASTLSSSPSGGTWLSGNTGIATVGSSTGTVTGVSAGTVIITYTLGSGCSNTQSFTVNTTPSAISGPSSVCSGSTITLSSSPSGGTWSSSNTAIATVGSSTGVVSGASLGTANITYMIGSCFAVKTVTVTSAPGAISGTTVVCEGATTALSCTPSGGAWTSASTGTATIGSSTGVVTGISAGTSAITYSLGTGCESYATVTVNTAPTAITGVAAVCVSATTTLSSSPSGGTWTSGNLGVATVGSGTGVVTGLSSGTADITYTLSSGCFVVRTVTVNTSPGAISGTASVCAGATTTLSCSPSGGTWTSASTGIATIGSGTGVVTGVSAGTSDITYSLGAGCESYATVTVNTAPTAITGTASVCVGATTTLSSSPSGGTWTSGSTGVATVGSGTGVVTGASSGTANITYTLSGGCFVVRTVTVNTAPGAISGTASVCEGATTTLSCSPSGGTWTSGSTGTATIGSGTGVVTGVSAGTSDITYSLGAGCESYVTVTVNTAPTAITGTAFVCVGGTTTLSSSPSGGTWTSGSTGVATVGSGTGVVTGASSGTADITYTLSGGCFAVRTVTVNTAPGAISGTASVCIGATTTLSCSPSGGTWTSGSTGIATIGSGTGVVTGVSAGTSAITYSLGAGCESYITATVNALPGSISGTTAMCAGATNTLSSSPSGGTWTSGSTGIATVGSASGDVTGVSGGTAVITYTIGTGCFITTTVTINALPTITLGASPTVVTGSTSANLPYSAVSGGPTTYSIVYSGAAITAGFANVAGAALGSSPIVLTVPGAAPLATYTATLTVTSATCTSTGYPFTVTINGGNSAPLFSGGSPQTLSACANPTFNSIDALLAVDDPDVGNTETWSVTSAPIHGTITIGGTVVSTGSTVTPTGFGYTATAGYTGTDVFTMQVSDGAGGLATTTINVTVNPLPAPFTVTGGGGYCSGGTGVHVGLSGSAAGISYQLYNGVTATGSPLAGTGSALDFGLQTSAGTYTVVATNTTTSCSVTMTGSVDVVINPLPTAYAVTGGGLFCSGGPGVLVSLAGSDVGVNYQLYRGTTTVGGPVAGTGGPIGFGLMTIAGTYTVVATDVTTGCVNTMSGSTGITVGTLPAIVTMTGGGGYCSGGVGVNVGLTGSAIGIDYQLYRGGVPVGAPLPGIGGALSFGLQTIAGVYTATATNPLTSCTSTMSGSSTVTIYSLPAIYTVTGGGSFCSGGTGVAVGLSNSDIGVNYQLYRGGLPVVGTITPGTGTALSFGLQITAGTYTVVATSAGFTGCTSNMTGSAIVSIDPLPSVYIVTGGGSYCVGGTGVHVFLSNSDAGVNYQLFMGTTTVGGPVAGTGTTLDFGLMTTAGTYTVVATNATTGCVNNMYGSATVSVNPLPTVYTVTGGGGYCSGGSGIAVGLSNSTFGISYQLYLGASAVGSPVTGVGGAISFGLQTAPGIYTVVATNMTTGCVNNMSGSVTVSITSIPTVYTVTGGGGYCAGGTGVAIGLSNSDAGINYQLYRGSITIGGPMGGTGGAISFGLFTIAGTYTVVAYNPSTGCTTNMTGSATITVLARPAVIAMTGGGGYCAGGPGVNIGLVASAIGIDYQLYFGGSPVGLPVSGTGAALSFGLQTTVGTYTATATDPVTLCTSNMSGSASVYMYALPNVYSVTGGGSYCSGGTGVAIGLSGSDAGAHYQLYLGGLPVVGAMVIGTGSAISFGPRTIAGTYTVIATIGGFTGCTNAMSGSAVIAIDPLPVAYTVTGGGSYCSGGTGVHIGLSSSDAGIDYQLYMGTSAIGSPMAGTGSALDFGLFTAAGTYTIKATNTTTACINNMIGSVTITISSLPYTFAVTGGGGYCTGGSGVLVGLAGSVWGTDYQLFLGASAVGSPVAGTGTGLSFGLQTAAGTYTVVATSTLTGCTNTMTGSAVVTINPLPATFTVSGGGSYCAGGTGLHVLLSGSASGTVYQLYRGTAPVGSALSGTGSGLDFGSQTIAGTYTVVATTSGSLCTSTMTGSAVITVDPLPLAFPVTGGGGYCSGDTGVHVFLSSSTTGISYQLFRATTAVGSPLTGTGSPLDFGLQTIAGTYRVVATNTTTSCTSNMLGTATVIVNPLPTAYTLTGGGGYCAGGIGVSVGLSGSQTGVNYQLYLGASPVGSPTTGTGLAITFGLQTAAGTYTVVATRATTGCVNNMTGSVTITINPLPAVYTVTGGGSYCSGGTGVAIGLSNSDAGINYQLYRGSVLVGSPVAGTGSSISFGLQTAAGTYTVLAIDATTGCTSAMSGSATVSINALPAVVSVTGGGGYCVGGTGVLIGLSASAIGIDYQLYLGTTAVGSPVPGTGAALSFGLQTAAGTYTVIATNPVTSCSSTMSGSATIYIYPLPVTYTVTGGGSYCLGGAGVVVGLSGSSSGVSYQLYLGGLPLIGTVVSGTGSAISFGLRTVPGTYTVVATMGGFTACTATMSGSAVVATTSSPTIYTVTGGGSYCSGGTGVHIYLSNSDTGVSYQLYMGTVAIGSPLSGTGTTLDFGLYTTVGSYTIIAYNPTTGCSGYMSGIASVSVSPLPYLFTVTGGGSYCAGGTGVAVGLSSTVSGTNYQLYLGTTAVGSPVPGTGAAITFGLQTAAGTYTVVATNTTTGCTNTMTGSVTITITAAPAAFTVTGGGTYCSGGSGVHIGLSSSATGVSYQLYRGTAYVGSAISGTGSALDFGLQTVSGTYTVVATLTGTYCTTTMTGSATISVAALPATYTVTGTGGYCPGGSGVHVYLSGSDTGVTYQLYVGTTPAGSPVAGTGSSIDFGLFTTAGTYTVVATGTATGCTSTMTGYAVISVYSLPTAYTVTGGGSYCSGGTGSVIGLAGSQAGVSYQLYNGASAVGSPVTGSGGAISFGSFTTAGTYTVVGTNTSTGCVNSMTGSATITINTPPNVYAVTGGGSYCYGGTGVAVGLSGSDAGVNYRLYRGTVAVGSPVAGTGSALSFGLQTVSGTYTVVATDATTLCVSTMTGSASVSISSLPAIVSMTGGGGYCSGGTGVNIGLAASAVGVNYQLYLGTTAIGSPVAGTGMALSFGLQTAAGTYTATATYPSSSCSSTMSGSATVYIYSVPTAYTVSGGGGFCSGGTGVHIYLSGSSTGTSYKLYRGTLLAGSPIPGTGSAIDFGLYTTPGTYTILGVATSTGCSTAMTGSATIFVNPLPTISGSIYTVAPGANITLTGTPGGGTFNSTSTAIATVGTTTGIVTGVSLGSTIISYTLTTGCASSHIVGVTATGHRDIPGANTTITGTEGSDLFVSPNPSKGVFTLKGNLSGNSDAVVSLQVTDMLGRVIYKNKVTAANGIMDEVIDLGNVPNGMYLLTVHSDIDNKVFHIIVRQ